MRLGVVPPALEDALRRFPDRAVVREENASWVEVGESLQPVLVGGKRLLRAVKRRLAGQLVGCEVGGELVRLAGEDYRAVGLPEDQRLMPLGVPWGRNDPDARPDLLLTGEFLIGRGREIDQLVEGVIAAAGSGQLDVLDQDGLAAQEGGFRRSGRREAADRDEGDVVKSDSGRGRGILQVPALGTVVGFGLGVRCADAGIEEEQTVIVLRRVGAQVRPAAAGRRSPTRAG